MSFNPRRCVIAFVGGAAITLSALGMVWAAQAGPALPIEKATAQQMALLSQTPLQQSGPKPWPIPSPRPEPWPWPWPDPDKPWPGPGPVPEPMDPEQHAVAWESVCRLDGGAAWRQHHAQ